MLLIHRVKYSEMKTDGYDVPKDVVLDVPIYMEEEFDILNFDLDLSKFEKTEISNMRGVFDYRNEYSGGQFTGTSDKLHDFQLSHSKNQEYLEYRNH